MRIKAENILLHIQCLWSAALSLLLIGCGGGGSVPGKWQEEVKLENGKILSVEREFRFGTGDISQSHGPLGYASLKFNLAGRSYLWEGNGLRPLVLQVEASGAPMVISAIPYCSVWERRGQPDSRYVFERYEHGVWREVSPNEVRVSLANNLILDGEKITARVSLADKATADRRQIGSAYLLVDLASPKMNCR